MSTKEQKERLIAAGNVGLLICGHRCCWGLRTGTLFAKAIEFNSDDVLQVEQGSLYPALHRLIKRGWIAVEAGVSGEQSAGEILPVDGEGAAATGG